MRRQSFAALALVAIGIAPFAAEPPTEPKSGNSAAAPDPASQPKSPPKEENKSQRGQPGKMPAGKKMQPGPGWPWFGFPGAAPISRSLLLGVPEVVDEIALAEAQRSQLTAALREQRSQMGAAFANVRFREFQELSRDEREKRLAGLRRKVDNINKTTEAKIGQLLDAKQLARLEQLRVQREGLHALNRPEIAKQLGLTDEQQEKIRKILREGRAQFRWPANPDATETERREAFARWQKQIEKTRADVLAALTPSQQAQWTQLKGKPFVFPQPRGFGPPPGGRLPGAPGPGRAQ